MQATLFEEGLEQLLAGDSRYHRDAYRFVAKAIEFAQKQAGRKIKSDDRLNTDEPHAPAAKAKPGKRRVQSLTAADLLAAVRDYGLAEFGPMAMDVFAEWGIQTCADFGEIALALAGHGLLKKTGFRRADFTDGYDFSETFRHPFRPKNRLITPIGTETVKH